MRTRGIDSAQSDGLFRSVPQEGFQCLATSIQTVRPTFIASPSNGENSTSAASASSLPSTVAPTSLPSLTLEEKIVLRGLALGKKNKVIGIENRIMRPVLYALLASARQKTGAKNRIALAIWAMKHPEALR